MPRPWSRSGRSATVAIREYVGSGEWRGRAGGYAIQGLGGRLVERIEGDYANVVGLPAALLLTTLERELPDLLDPVERRPGRKSLQIRSAVHSADRWASSAR